MDFRDFHIPLPTTRLQLQGADAGTGQANQATGASVITTNLINVMIITATVTITAITTYAAFMYLLEYIDGILTKRKRAKEEKA